MWVSPWKLRIPGACTKIDLAARNDCSATPEVEGTLPAESTNLTLFVSQRNISRGYLVDYRLFIFLHRNRVDSADTEKDFRENTVRISDCRASSILKTVTVSQDFMLNASSENLSTTIRNLYLDSLGISEQTLILW